jgi:hypothetical protein
MTEQRLTIQLKAGYPNFKKWCGLPPYLLPERSFTYIVDRLEDKTILAMIQPLNLEVRVSCTPEKLETNDMIPEAAWQEACLQWPPLVMVEPVIWSLLEAADRIMAQYARGQLKVNSLMVCHGLLVLSCATFIPQGKSVLKDMAKILQGDESVPGDLITRYAKAVTNNDLDLVTGIDQCIKHNPDWSVWVLMMQEQAQKFTTVPKIIGISPPSTSEVVAVLAEMIKEALDAGT